MDIEHIKKHTVYNKAGIKYTDFRNTLTPNYTLVWLHISLGYIGIATAVTVAILTQNYFPAYFWLTIPALALVSGYLIAYIHLFIHEAAHYNIHSDKETNDKLANIFIGLLIGLDIKFYRAVHFDHHRFLGTSNDTEKTYFKSLDFGFVLESLTGIMVLKVLMNRNAKVSGSNAVSSELVSRNKRMFISGIGLNIVFAAIIAVVGYWQVALGWLGGLMVIFPFFASLRQLLEHRSEEADRKIDYNQTAPPKITRMFGKGIIASTMGAAGFNRHLIHHWDPNISYTRLKDVEFFLADTEEAQQLMHKSKSTYFKTFIQLFNK